MRVTGGEFGGRRLGTPDSGAIRPTQDRVREALFSMLAPELGGADFLDLYAGSGSVGIEALSRGAAKAVFVESARAHAKVLSSNLDMLGLSGGNRARVVVAPVESWMAGYSGDGFSMVFADPPYALWKELEARAFFEVLSARGIVRPGGLFVAETDMTCDPPSIEGWELLRNRLYGKTRIALWRRKQ